LAPAYIILAPLRFPLEPDYKVRFIRR
jgi:hypothetical protein